MHISRPSPPISRLHTINSRAAHVPAYTWDNSQAEGENEIRPQRDEQSTHCSILHIALHTYGYSGTHGKRLQSKREREIHRQREKGGCGFAR